MSPDYLNEQEQAAIIGFTSNPKMVEAVRKVLLATIFNQGTLAPGKQVSEFNFAFNIANSPDKSDEQMGQELRAAATALNYLKSGFDRLQEIQMPEPAKKAKTNPAL